MQLALFLSVVKKNQICHKCVVKIVLCSFIIFVPVFIFCLAINPHIRRNLKQNDVGLLFFIRLTTIVSYVLFHRNLLNYGLQKYIISN